MTTAVPASRTGTEKIRLFRTLFRGREDVFPKRWENSKQGRSGYSPACANEWVRGVCGKPRVKCGQCPNQQWQLLAKIERIGDDRVRTLAREAVRTARVLAISPPSDEEEDDEPWKPKRSAVATTKLPFVVPREVRAVLAQRLFVEKTDLPAPLLSRLRRIAAFQNPEFYKRQKLRLSTARTPRIVVCAEDLPKHLALPRACVDEVRSLLEANGSQLACDDQRSRGQPVTLKFVGTLTPEQNAAVQAMLVHGMGVLVAPPGSGKTVMGAAIVAARGVSTLVLVHRRPLLDQWMNQLALFLGIDPAQIGRLGGGKNRLTGTLDVAMIQSLAHEGQVMEAVGDYGQVVVDECHHVPAVSFERVLASARAKFIVGLTATPRRRDGHHPIGAFQLGPVRHAISAKAQAAARPFEHKLIVRETQLIVPEENTFDPDTLPSCGRRSRARRDDCPRRSTGAGGGPLANRADGAEGPSGTTS